MNQQRLELSAKLQKIRARREELVKECNDLQQQLDCTIKQAETLEQKKEKLVRTSALHEANKATEEVLDECKKSAAECQAMRVANETESIWLEEEYQRLLGRIKSLTAIYNSSKFDRDQKCCVCEQRSIEFAMVPCFHFSYCEPCIGQADKCKICHNPKQGIQRIYYG